ncbi:sensor histidine kinase [Pontibacter fetidus]|uniref:histidine kinase n=1 Tax=Pontibacter fetidus TaxID=2700082 RepID=A0A6B2GXS9_9BACT|nr:PAS domain-containing protein [Pontibacter fetidus]NDK55655.1 PAS domain-containing protein [Pontibacter fetidus]
MQQQLPFLKIFEAQSELGFIVSPELYILAVTDSLLKETFTLRENIVGKYVFDVFPDNPGAPDASSTTNLKSAFNYVLSEGKPHRLNAQRYDIFDPEEQGSFIERYWHTNTVPILNDAGEVVCILHETINVTDEIMARRQLQESQERERIAVAQAEQQRLRLERLFEQAPAALALLEGPDFVFKVLNKTYKQLFPEREMLGRPLIEALPELKDQPVYDIIQHVYNSAETYEGKEAMVPMVRHHGQPAVDMYWNFIYQALFDAQGKVSGILIFSLDVTEFVKARQQVEKSAASLQKLSRELEGRVEQRTMELKLAQREAERQSNRLNSLFMQAPAAICILNGPDLVYEFVNPTYASLFPGRQLLGKPILDALPEIKDNKVYQTFREVYETGTTHEEKELLIPFVRAEVSEMEDRYFRFIQQPRYNEQEQVDGVVVFALEVTEQVKARKSEEASVKQLRLVTNSLPVLIGYLDREERYRFANKAYEKWFPHKSEDLIGKKLKDVIGEIPYQNIKEYVKEGLAGKAVVFEARMPYRQDFVKHIHCCYVPDIQHGVVHGFYTLITDITDDVQVRQALKDSEQKSKAIAAMLAVTNQELKLANDALGKYNYELEIRVEQRTSELQNSNKLLQKQITENKKAEQSLSESHTKLQALTRHLQVMREDERKYIARELHDELGQAFTALKIDLTLIMKKLAAGKMEKELFYAELQSMMKTINTSITAVREIVATLRPTVLDNFGLLSEIESQAQEFQKRTAISLQLNTSLKYIPLGQEAAIEVYRIIQESLTNIARHSWADEATITIDKSRNHFRFIVTDNGKGIEAGNLTQLRTFGLLGMQERADRIGASLTFDTMAKKGARIVLKVPITPLSNL